MHIDCYSEQSHDVYGGCAGAAWWTMASHLAAQDYLNRLQAAGMPFPSMPPEMMQGFPMMSPQHSQGTWSTS